MSYNTIHINENDEITVIGNISSDNFNMIDIDRDGILFLSHEQIDEYRDIIQTLNEDKLKAVTKQEIAINQYRRREFMKRMKLLSNIQCHLHNLKASREAEEQRYNDYLQTHDL